MLRNRYMIFFSLLLSASPYVMSACNMTSSDGETVRSGYGIAWEYACKQDLEIMQPTPDETIRPKGSDRILADLSRCDSAFFATLGKRDGEYSSNPYFRVSGSNGYFKVADRSDSELNIRKLTPSLMFSGLEAVAYFDEILDIEGGGVIVFWGFLFRAPINDVVTSTQSLLWEGQRLRKDGRVFVRSEVWTHGSEKRDWEKIATFGGQRPKHGTVERVLLIEPFEGDPSLTRFGCSLQGTVTREMLRSERPDLGIND